MIKKRETILIAGIIFALIALGLVSLQWGTINEMVSRAPQTNALSESQIDNSTYDATNGAEQIIVVGRGATTPQTNALSESQIANSIYDSTNGAKQVIVSSNSSDLAFINTTSLTDGDFLVYDTTGTEWRNTEGKMTFDDNNRLHLPQENTPATPTLTFGDADTGFYSDAGNSVRFASNGTARFGLSGGTFSGLAGAGAPGLYNAAGSATEPTFYFSGDGNTGIYRVGADQIGISTAGALQVEVEATGETKFTAGIVPPAKTADPCGSGFPEGAIFYNDTKNVLCYCNGTDDLEVHDNSACF